MSEKPLSNNIFLWVFVTLSLSFSFGVHFMLPLVYSKWSYWADSRIVKQVFPKWALSCVVAGMASVLPFASG